MATLDETRKTRPRTTNDVEIREIVHFKVQDNGRILICCRIFDGLPRDVNP